MQASHPGPALYAPLSPVVTSFSAAGSAYSIVWSSPARPPIPWLTRAISAAHSGVGALVPPSEAFWPRMKTW